MPTSLITLGSYRRVSTEQVRALVGARRSSDSVVFESKEFPVDHSSFIPVARVRVGQRSVQMGMRDGDGMTRMVTGRIVRAF